MVLSWRSLHTWLGVAAFLPLLLTISSGFAYRLLRDGVGVGKPSVQWLMAVHTLSLLSLQAVYPLLVAVFAFGLALSSLPMRPIRRLLAAPSLTRLRALLIPDVWSARTQHRALTMGLTLPLLLTAVTGAVWTIQRHWLGAAKADVRYLMAIHQGSMFGSALLYTSLVFGLSLLGLLPGLMLVRSVAALLPRQVRAKVRS